MRVHQHSLLYLSTEFLDRIEQYIPSDKDAHCISCMYKACNYHRIIYSITCNTYTYIQRYKKKIIQRLLSKREYVRNLFGLCWRPPRGKGAYKYIHVHVYIKCCIKKRFSLKRLPFFYPSAPNHIFGEKGQYCCAILLLTL